jgi:integrase
MNRIKKNTPKKQNKQCSPENYFALSRVTTSTPTHTTNAVKFSGDKPHLRATNISQSFKTICPQDTPIFNVLWNMKKNGMAYDTIRNVDKALSALSQRCDLTKPELVKVTIAEFESDGYKRNLKYAYNKYAEFYGLEWEKPKYWQPQKIPKIPLEKHIEAVIANSSIKTASAISKDTGLRPCELLKLTLKDIDLENGIVYPESAKHGTPRTLKLTQRTLTMLKTWLLKENIGNNKKIFGKWTTENYGKNFRYYRNKTAKKLGEPTIQTVKLYHLRHYYATMLLKKTNNLLIVKMKLGHHNINHTLKYAQVLDIEGEENYSSEIAETIEQARKLIESGFEYVTEMDGQKLFRKHK